MELFNELKNQYVHGAEQMINRLYREKSVDAEEFLEELQGGNRPYAEKVADYICFCRDGDNIRLRLDGPLPIRPSQSEKVWLLAMLRDPKCALFLSEEERALLRTRLEEQGVPDLTRHIAWKPIAADPDLLDEDYCVRFRTVLRAIRERRYLSFLNETPKRIVPGKDMIPYGLEYSVTEEIFRVVFRGENRPIKCNLARMSAVELGEPVPDYRSAKENVEVRKVGEPAVLEIKNARQAVERAALLFSNFDRRNDMLYDEQGCLTGMKMEISYYEFQKGALIQKILSFGPMVKVLGNENILKEIKAVLEANSSWSAPVPTPSEE